MGIVIVSLLLGGSPRLGSVAATRQDEPATPLAAASCGEAGGAWSDAAANQIRARLIRLRANQRPIDSDPPAHRRVAARLTIENESAERLPLGLDAFALVTCDGSVFPALADPERKPPSEELGAGRSNTGWVSFVVPEEAEPILLVVRIDDETTCWASLGFPLVLAAEDGDATPAPEPVGAPAPLSRFLEPCAGGNATSGVTAPGESASGGVDRGDGTGGAIGQDGADGGDAVGGDAVGGDGCPGEDVVGANATGGDGGDGGDAVSGEGQVILTVPGCPSGETP